MQLWGYFKIGFMQQKIKVILINKVLEFNGSLRFNDSLSLCNKPLICFSRFKMSTYIVKTICDHIQHIVYPIMVDTDYARLNLWLHDSGAGLSLILLCHLHHTRGH